MPQLYAYIQGIFIFEQFIWFESFESKILNIKFYNNLLYRKDWLDDKAQHAFWKWNPIWYNDEESNP
jgi:hypothetical protein